MVEINKIIVSRIDGRHVRSEMIVILGQLKFPIKVISDVLYHYNKRLKNKKAAPNRIFSGSFTKKKESREVQQHELVVDGPVYLLVVEAYSVQGQRT